MGNSLKKRQDETKDILLFVFSFHSDLMSGRGDLGQIGI